MTRRRAGRLVRTVLPALLGLGAALLSTALATHAALGPLPADQLAQVTYGAAAQP